MTPKEKQHDINNQLQIIYSQLHKQRAAPGFVLAKAVKEQLEKLKGINNAPLDDGALQPCPECGCNELLCGHPKGCVSGKPFDEVK